MATAAMNRYSLPNVGSYHTPQSASPASVQSPQHDPQGRPMHNPNYPPQGMYQPYGAYGVQQPSPYAHPGAPQPSPLNTGFMSQPAPGPALQHTSHPGMTGSPGNKMAPNQMHRSAPGMSPASATPQAPPTLHQVPGAPGVNPNAAPGQS